MFEKLNLTGKRIGRITVIEELKAVTGNGTVWRCKCDCGKEFIEKGFILNSGKRKTCGCTMGQACDPNKLGIKLAQAKRAIGIVEKMKPYVGKVVRGYEVLRIVENEDSFPKMECYDHFTKTTHMFSLGQLTQTEHSAGQSNLIRWFLKNKGNKFDTLIVKDVTPDKKIKCVCEHCGEVIYNSFYQVKKLLEKGCECQKDKYLIGKKFNKLTVIERTKMRNSDKRVLFRCKCDCGGERLVTKANLIHNQVKSCLDCKWKRKSKSRVSTRRKSTEKRYKSTRDKHLMPYIGKVKNDTIVIGVVQDYSGKNVTWKLFCENMQNKQRTMMTPTEFNLLKSVG